MASIIVTVSLLTVRDNPSERGVAETVNSSFVSKLVSSNSVTLTQEGMRPDALTTTSRGEKSSTEATSPELTKMNNFYK